MILNILEYATIIPGYTWLCLNVPKSVWMDFLLHLSIVIPYLKEHILFFLTSKNLKFPIADESTWLYFRLNIFTSKIANLLLSLGADVAGGHEYYTVNDIPNKYIYDDFLMIYLSILLLLFCHFLGL